MTTLTNGRLDNLRRTPRTRASQLDLLIISQMRQFLLDPFGEPGNAGKIFESPYGILRDQFAKRKVRLETVDQGDLAKADKILFFNYNPALYRRCVSLGIPQERFVLFAFEPSVVIPTQHNLSLWKKFGSVFTHDDTRVDGRRIFKLRYPQAKSLNPGTPSFEQRKPLVLINANKYSYEPGELYSLRRRAIRYFEAREPGFDLYGYGWGVGLPALSKGTIARALINGKPHRLLKDAVTALRPYRSYRGSVEDKYTTLAGYRFCICFENEAKTPGYITEKIFDCLVAGTIPIYLGTPNITEYLPSETFIDMRDFADFDELSAHLNSVGGKEVTKMRKAAEEYLRSPAFEEWQPEAVFASIVKVLA